MHPLEAWRRSKGLTQRQLAERVDCSQSYISEIETGEKYPADRDLILRICEATGLTADDILRWERPLGSDAA